MGTETVYLSVNDAANDEHPQPPRASFDSIDGVDISGHDSGRTTPTTTTQLSGQIKRLWQGGARSSRSPLLQAESAMGVERRIPRLAQDLDSATSQGPEGSLLADQQQHHAHGESLPIVVKTKRVPWLRLGIYQLLTLPILALLIFGAVAASRRVISPSNVPMTLFNGTSHFAPTTLIISLDGFRADFLHRGLTPTLTSFIRQGVSPRYMLPSFPSLTFPNHWTIATGLYPETHGLVANRFWDPESKRSFSHHDKQTSLEPYWWGGESFWASAEKQGLRTAIHMWPGSEAHLEPEATYVDKFNAHEPLGNKVDRILGLLDLPGRDDEGHIPDKPRPQLIAAYVPNIDSDGHLFGPNSTEIHATIHEVDNMLGELFEGIESRNLTNIVNVIVVSDHGMATTSTSRLIQIDDIIDMSKIEFTDGWPHSGLRPKDPSDLEPLYTQLKAASDASPGSFEVYLRDKNMPERYHFAHNPRIAPLWVIPNSGWAIVSRPSFDAAKAREQGKLYHPRGIHGYDHEHPLMRAIFVARGPAFPHPPGSKVDDFHNIEVYNLVCDSIGIKPDRNNGTLRLPLKPSGLHDRDPPGEMPYDFESSDVDENGSLLIEHELK